MDNGGFVCVSPTSQVLCDYLLQHHKGAKVAVHSKEISSALHMTNREIRYAVHELRCKGKPICSNDLGYYYAENTQEVQNTVTQLSSRVHKITKARDGLMRFISSAPQVE